MIKECFNNNWLFHLEDIENGETINLDDSAWRHLNVPHDWSVEFSFDKEKGEGCTGYLLGGIAWYRKHFLTPINSKNKLIFINFDGIYNNSSIYVNGKLVCEHPYGYTPIYCDVTGFLEPEGKENVIAVRVDHSRYADSRWYTGSGIYRDVELVVLENVHIPINGTFITTPEISPEKAVVNEEIIINNTTNVEATVAVESDIYFNGQCILSNKKEISINANTEITVKKQMVVENPNLWGLDMPNMYTMINRVVREGEVIQEYTTPFGIRYFEFNKQTGFSLNGESMKIKGVCIHHDGGLVGAAVPDDVWRRRFALLKEAGCNAIRTAHNPPSARFLDLCDEMGLLVQDEIFDDWDNPKDKRLNGTLKTSTDYITESYTEHFQECAESDLRLMMKRDRNHPSIIQWSIGNEIEWTYPDVIDATGFFGADASGNYFWTLPPYSKEEINRRYNENKKEKYTIEETGKKLIKWTRELDTTRAVTMNCILPSGTYETGLIDELDVVGYSYRRVVYDYGQENYKTPVMGNENLAQWHDWKAVMERDFVAGMFIWTGVDYLGESNNQWPTKATASGLLDSAGFLKPSYNMMKALWTNKPQLSLYTNTAEKSIYQLNENGVLYDTTNGGWENRVWVWHDVNEHYNYEDNEMLVIEAYSNCDEVELFINGESVGVQRLSDWEDHIYKWRVPYEAGEVKAVGKYANGEVVESILKTTSDATKVKLTVDKDSISANSQDCVHVIAQLVDSKGNAVTHHETTVEFVVEGNGNVLGVDNGWKASTQDFKENKVTTHNGRALMIIQAGTERGEVKITAKSNGLDCGQVAILVK